MGDSQDPYRSQFFQISQSADDPFDHAIPSPSNLIALR